MNSQPLDGYQYPYAPPPYQPMMDQSHQWLALPTATMGNMVHAQPPMPQQTWAFMNPALGTTTTFSQVPVVGVMPQMGDMIPAPMPPTIHMMPEPTQYEPVIVKKSSSKPKSKGSKSGNKADKYASGLTQYATFYDGLMGTQHQGILYDIEPPPKKSSSKKSAQPQQEIYTIGEEHRYIKRKNSQSRKLEQAKRRVMGQVVDDMMAYPRCMTPLTPSYAYVNDLDATQTQMSIIQPTYTPMQVTQQWGPTAIPTTMATIVTPSPMIPMKMPMANAYTTINTVQLPMTMEQIPAPHGAMPMEMMMEPHPMAPPMQKTTMMPMMTSQPVQAVPVPVLPSQCPSQGIVMEPIVTKPKTAPSRAGKASQEDGTTKGTTRGSGSSKRAKSHGPSKADVSAGVKFPVHSDGPVTMSIAPNSVMKPLQPATASAPVAFPVLQGLSTSPPFHPLDSGEMTTLVTSQSALPLGVPLNTFAPSPPPPVQVQLPDVPLQPLLPLMQSQPVSDASPVMEQQKVERSLVDEIKRDKEAFADVQKDKICAPRMLIESFQQILDNKRRRMRSCLTEDCKNLLGEFTKIGVPFPVKWVDDQKHFYIKDIITNLLPYHMFYYEELRPNGEERPQRDYSRVEDEIKELKKTIIGMKVKSPLVHQGYECTKLCLDALSKLSLRKARSAITAPPNH